MVEGGEEEEDELRRRGRGGGEGGEEEREGRRRGRGGGEGGEEEVTSTLAFMSSENAAISSAWASSLVLSSGGVGGVMVVWVW